MLNNYAQKGTRVAKPAPWHSDSKQLRTPDLKVEDIPLVILDGAVLNAPPKEEVFNPLIHQVPQVADLSKRIDQIEANIASIAQAVSSLSNVNRAGAPKRGRPKKNAQDRVNSP